VQIGMINFDMAKSELDHHVEKMKQIRALKGSLLQGMCQLYIYLRDGASKPWRSLRLLEARIETMIRGGDVGYESSVTQGF
jgi:hypothetical protein